MKQRAKQHRRPKPGAYYRYVYTMHGRCYYCKREITYEQLKAGERISNDLSARQSAQMGSLRAVRITAHRACRLKALLGIKHYRRHL